MQLITCQKVLNRKMFKTYSKYVASDYKLNQIRNTFVSRFLYFPFFRKILFILFFFSRFERNQETDLNINDKGCAQVENDREKYLEYNDRVYRGVQIVINLHKLIIQPLKQHLPFQELIMRIWLRVLTKIKCFSHLKW